MVSAPTSLKAGDPASLGFNDPGGHRLKAARLRTQRAAEMVSNRAALPTTPKYPATPKALFRQLREMGVGCGTCRNALDDCEIWKPEFLCDEWEGK